MAATPEASAALFQQDPSKTQTSTARFAAIGLGLLPTPLTCDVGFVVNGMPVKGFESPERQTFTEG
ncbi:MAG: hypothetical protein GX607_09770, partial [Myxococcales bacterium]|nr:hypothetical protein [Myxococcales bacterium]